MIPLTIDENQAIRRWLDWINERNPETIEQVLQHCREDPEAKVYFLKRAEEVPGAAGMGG